jgi:hypothetical protein
MDISTNQNLFSDAQVENVGNPNEKCENCEKNQYIPN